MIIDGHNLSSFFQMVFVNERTEPQNSFSLVWCSDVFCLILRLPDVIGRMTKIENRYRIEIDSFEHASHPKKHDTTSGIT